jgi:hypothetical protein
VTNDRYKGRAAFHEDVRRAPIRHTVRWVLVFGMASLALINAWTDAMAYEEPEYQLVRTYPDFEVRRYPPQMIAETVVDGAFSEVGGGAFRILADYISGNNRPGEKISMTAPVAQQPGDSRIAMTAPVGQSTTGDGRFSFFFFMPSQYTRETLPIPNDPRVRIRELEERTMAVLQYSGSWREDRYRAQETKLKEALRRQGLRIVGEPVFARYNSPFSLWFLRRNEVMIPVDETSIGQAPGDTQ